MPDWIVEEDAVIGTSPMVLPPRCVKCGEEASEGARVETTLYWYPRWIWVGIFWGIFPVFLLYYAARRRLEITYWLCADHAHEQRVREWAAIGAWALFVALLVAAIATRGNKFCLIAAGVLFVAAFILQIMTDRSLWVAGHEDGTFGVKGFSRDFLSMRRRSTA